MMRLSVSLIVRGGGAAATASALQRLMLLARGNAAYVGGHLSMDLLSPDTLHYFEEWATERDLREQVHSERFRNLTALIETVTEPPQLSVEAVVQTFGFDYLEDASRKEKS